MTSEALIPRTESNPDAVPKIRSFNDPEVQLALRSLTPEYKKAEALTETLRQRRALAKTAPDGLPIDERNWKDYAKCKEDTPDALFVRGAEQNIAKLVCSRCVVKEECLSEALTNQIEWGVWGGLTERERRALLRKKP